MPKGQPPGSELATSSSGTSRNSEESAIVNLKTYVKWNREIAARRFKAKHADHDFSPSRSSQASRTQSGIFGKLIVQGIQIAPHVWNNKSLRRPIWSLPP
jgi:hypothetical protein